MKQKKPATQHSKNHPENDWQNCKVRTGSLIVLSCVVYLAHAYFYNFIADDSFITLRYAQNLAEGHGLVFNPNERVEGFTSFLWTVLLAGMYMLGCDLLLSARWIGLAFGLITLILAYRLVLVSSDRRVPSFIAAIVPLALASNGSFACWATSGMETMLFICLVVASFLTVISGNMMLSAFVVIALILTRPESLGVLVILSLFQVFQYRKSSPKRTLVWLTVCWSAVAALFVFRYLYYGDWLPNTYYVKTGGGFQMASRGIAYLAQYAKDHEGLIFMMVPMIYGFLVNNIKQRLVALGVTFLWFGTVMVGGDGLPMYRFALAPLPLLIALQVSMMVSWYDTVKYPSESQWKLYVASIAGVLLLITANVTILGEGLRYKLFEHQKLIEIPRWTQVGIWFHKNAKEGESLAAVPIGAVTYYSGLAMRDMMGLTDRHIAHLIMPDMGKGWAGHEKHDGQYILSRKPTYLLLGNIDVTGQPRDPNKTPFIPYSNSAIWDREKDLYQTNLIQAMYKPRSVEIAPGQILNFYELRDEYKSTPNKG